MNITKLKMELKSDNPRTFSYHNASLTQGVLMEKITPQYGEYLHQSQLHPYTQSFIREGERLYWTVNTLDDMAEQEMIVPLESEDCSSIYIRNRDCHLDIIKKEKEQMSYEKLLEQYYFTDRKRFIKIKFRTPTAFKQNNRYCIFPTTRLIFQSLMLKYDSCCKENQCFDEEILQQYEQNSAIVQYKLQSTTFSMEGVKIPSFIGEVTMKIFGPQQMVNFAWMLAKFGTYSGIGIKASVGMGMIELEEREEMKK